MSAIKSSSSNNNRIKPVTTSIATASKGKNSPPRWSQPHYYISRRHQRDMKRTKSTPTSLKESSQSLFNRLCLRRSQTSPLGFLPDGHAVCWFHCDPKALYIRARSTSLHRKYEDLTELANQRKFCAMIKKKEITSCSNTYNKFDHLRLSQNVEKKMCCIWGCSSLFLPVQTINSTTKRDQDQREILSFPTTKNFG